jgi:DNA-binding NarL/FixJ family response regulator
MRDTPSVPPASRRSVAAGVRVLIADDDEIFAHLLRAKVTALEDVEVVGIAKNGREAVALAEALEPDLLLMDVYMPVLDGIDASRQIREISDDISVVLITGDDAVSDARAYEVGAAAYLRKSGDLVSIVDVVVAMSQVAAAAS